jgi:hypothetical protein
MKSLNFALTQLAIWRKKHEGNTAKRCLEAVRWACAREGLRLPWRPWPWNTALGCLSVLKKSPEKYGWRKVGRDDAGNLPDPCLIFFHGCGVLKDGRVAGHVAVLHNGRHWSNADYPLSPYWTSRVAGAFVPISR